MYNVPAESLAAECAAALKASKLIFVTRGVTLVDARSEKPVQSLRLAQAVTLLEQWGLQKGTYNYVEVDRNDQSHRNDYLNNNFYDGNGLKDSDKLPNIIPNNNNNNDDNNKNNWLAKEIDYSNNSSTISAYVRLLAKCVYALTGGVKRAHLIPTDRGALLKELFTRDGAGIGKLFVALYLCKKYFIRSNCAILLLIILFVLLSQLQLLLSSLLY